MIVAEWIQQVSIFYVITLITLVVLFVPAKAQHSLIQALSWLSWLGFSLILVSFHWFVVLYYSLRIGLTLLLFANIKLVSYMIRFFKKFVQPILWKTESEKKVSDFQRIRKLYEELENAQDYQAWLKVGLEIDFLEGNEKWKEDPQSDEYDWKLVMHHLEELKSLREKVFGQKDANSGDIHDLIFALRKVLHKNFGLIGNEMLYKNSVVGTKYLIDEFIRVVCSLLKEIAEDKKYPEFTAEEKFEFFKTAKISLGKSALCLSGGGALSMYHMGVVRALCRSNCVPSIVSGTSGGSIVAAVLAIYRDDELDDYINPEISNRMGVRWFEPLSKQFFNFLRKGYLMDNEFFQKAVIAYFGDWTFEEAYQKTKRSVTITLTISNRSPVTTKVDSTGPDSKLLLMNHMTSPNVLIRSCVHASCALPGLMEPVELLAKDRNGQIIPYMPGGVKFVDGSLKADLPMKRLSELFNATQYIVSQVNPHIVPFVVKREKKEGILSRLEYFSILELKGSVRKLAKMKLIPRVFGEDVNAIVLQKYRGDINIYPKLKMIDNFSAIQHPDAQDMDRFIRDGMKSAFPHLWAIKNSFAIEKVLEEQCKIFEKRVKLRERKTLIKRSKSTPRFGFDMLCEECQSKLKWIEANYSIEDEIDESEEYSPERGFEEKRRRSSSFAKKIRSSILS